MNREKVLEVKDLTVSFRTPNGLVRAVREVTFDLYKGETLAIVGESGSGKSVTTRAIMGILAGNGIIDKGEIKYRNQDLTKLSEANFHKIRGNKIGMIFQDPLSSLNPIMKIGKQITEAMLVNGDRMKNEYRDIYHHEFHDYLNKKTIIKMLHKDIENKVFELSNDDELSRSEKKTILKEYKARKGALIKAANADLPALKTKYKAKQKEAKVIINEKKAVINSEKKEMVAEFRTHLAPLREALTVAKANDKLKQKSVQPQVAGMKQQRDEELSVLKTKNLEVKEQNSQIEDVRARKIASKSTNKEYKLSVKEVKQKYGAMMKPLDETNVAKANLVAKREGIKDQREQFTRKLKVTRLEAYERAISIMDEVGIPESGKRFNQFPFQFSGGMRQRIVIAIALTASPELLICDEPTTALDVTIQGQILKLINDIKLERDLSVIFITHDLGVVANMADRVAVMYAGKIVEYGEAREIFYEPSHPYTWALLSSVPDLDTTAKLLSIAGTPPDMLFPPKGDAFADRNQYAMKIDFEEQPPYFKVSESHYAATWLLHPDAPKVEMPGIINERIQRYKQQAGKDDVRRARQADLKQSEGDQVE